MAARVSPSFRLSRGTLDFSMCESSSTLVSLERAVNYFHSTRSLFFITTSEIENNVSKTLSYEGTVVVNCSVKRLFEGRSQICTFVIFSTFLVFFFQLICLKFLFFIFQIDLPIKTRYFYHMFLLAMTSRCSQKLRIISTSSLPPESILKKSMYSLLKYSLWL